MPLTLALLGLLLPQPEPVQGSAPPADSVHVCAIYDYGQWRRDHPRPAAKRLTDLDVGDPRTVRMIYFLPNDRPFRQEVVDSIKVRIRQVQSFFVDQMEAHGHGKLTLRIETDALGEPLVHRVDGRHPDSHYLDDTHVVYGEIEEIFDLQENIYLVVVDHSSGTIGLGGGLQAGGTLSVRTATTDADGRAATTLTLGRQPGTNTVRARVSGLQPVTFTAIAEATPDFDGDGVTDFSDFFLFAEAFGGDDPRFDLDGSGTVDFTGQRVAVLHEGSKKAGSHRLRWDARDDQGRPLASGIYVYRLVTSEAVQTRKLTLLR